MDQQVKFKRIMRKVWYGTAITISALLIILSSAGVIGTWIVEQTLVDVTQSVLSATAKTAGGLRSVVAQIDQDSAELSEISSSVSAVSLKISQNVEDKGLVVTLLPAEQEAKLDATINSIQETLGTVREILGAGISMYRSVNRLPFVDLPGLSEETVDQIVQSVEQTQAMVEELRQNIQEFRSGVAEGVSRVTQAADRVTQGLDNLRQKLSELDQALAALQDLALRLGEVVPLAFGLGAVVLTALLFYIIYTQVEIIRMLVMRWKAMSPGVVEEPQPSTPSVVEETGITDTNTLP